MCNDSGRAPKNLYRVTKKLNAMCTTERYWKVIAELTARNIRSKKGIVSVELVDESNITMRELGDLTLEQFLLLK
jgi:hypothetical protein